MDIGDSRDFLFLHRKIEPVREFGERNYSEIVEKRWKDLLYVRRRWHSGISPTIVEKSLKNVNALDVQGLVYRKRDKGRIAAESQAALQRTTASGDQVEDQDDQRDHQQKVNQAPGYVETEAQNPQDQNDDEKCPKHIFSLASGAAASIQIGSWMILRANSQ
jgi:hypothetical protein